MPETARADDTYPYIFRIGINHLTHRFPELVAAFTRRLRREVEVHHHGNDWRMPVRQLFRGSNDAAGDSSVRLRHVHTEGRVEAALHHAAEKGNRETRVAFECRSRLGVTTDDLCERTASWTLAKLLPDVDSKRRVVIEVETL